MSPPDPTGACAIAVMAKESRPGRVKTRLVPPLRPEEAAELNSCCLRDIGANIQAAAGEAAIAGYAAYHPPGAEDFMRAVLPADFRLFCPDGQGIGAALVDSAVGLFAAGHPAVCLVNADSPNLPTACLVAAVLALARDGDRVVLGPSDDGGYYLIGLKRFHARLFEDIAWSTGHVLRQTGERAAEIGLDVVTLPAWYDVDDGAALERLAADLLGPERRGSAAPASTAFLARLRAGGRLPLPGTPDAA